MNSIVKEERQNVKRDLDKKDDLPKEKKGEFIGYAKCMADMKRKEKAAENSRDAE